MANTWTSPYNGFNPGTNPFDPHKNDKDISDWMLQQWQDRLQQQQLQEVGNVSAGIQTADPQVTGALKTAGPNLGPPTTAEKLKAASVGGANAGVTAQLAQAGTGMGQISDNMIPKPGRYYSDVTPDNILSLIQDPSQAMGYWAKFHGYNDAYANRLSSVFNINDLLRGMGIGGTQMSGTNELDWQGRLADRLSGRLKDSATGGYDYLNPQSIVQSIFSTPRAGLGTGANSLAISVNNPNLQPEEQITNVAQFVLGSLQGVLSNDQLNAYSQVLDQLATQFMRSYQTTPGGGAADRPTFLEFVRQNGGQYGGLF